MFDFIHKISSLDLNEINQSIYVFLDLRGMILL